MQDLGIQLKSMNIGKFTGIFIAVAIISIVLLVPTLPNWLVFLAVYPLVTSLIDIVIHLKT